MCNIRRHSTLPAPTMNIVATARLAALLPCLAGCTAIKPIVCTFTYPIDNIRERLDAPDAPDSHEDLPPVLVFVAAPVIIPLRFVSEAVIGCVGGLVSGFASDLNVLTGNTSSPAHNLTQAFRTNARGPR
jgi:hypothetical protein